VRLIADTDLDTGAIFGTIYEDSDGNATADEWDFVPSGAVVNLYDINEQLVAAVEVADETGRYTFTGVPPDPYWVRPTLPSGWSFLSPPSGSAAVAVSPGQTVTGVDFRVQRDHSSFSVTSNADSGPGSLREAIAMANAAGVPLSHIELAGVSTETILIDAPLESLFYPVIFSMDSPLDLSRGAGGVILDGSNCVDCDGLTLEGPGSYLMDLTIQNFDGYGVVLGGTGDHVLLRNTITGNASGGVLIASGNGDRIGGAHLGLPNTIQDNGGPGITVLSGVGHQLHGNSIEGNGGPAIDLGGNGVSPNDALDLDAGPNGLQNSPVVTSYSFVDGVTVTGSIDSRAFTTYTIDVYGTVACPGSGSGDASQWLGTGTVTTDGSGHGDFSIPVAFFAGELTATATDPDGSTSEVSDCLSTQVVDAPVTIVPTRFVHFAFPNPTAGPTTLSFALPLADQVEAHVYDVAGRHVRTLQTGRLPAGQYQLPWDGREEGGRAVSAGIYFYRLRVGGEDFHGKITRVR
jgi:hypothetical protein